MANYRLVTQEHDGTVAVSSYMPLARAVSWRRDHTQAGIHVMRIESDTGEVIDGDELTEVLAQRHDRGSCSRMHWQRNLEVR